MGLKTWLSNTLFKSGNEKQITVSGDGDLWSLDAEVTVRELAFWSCVNLMASAISKCEFRTFFGNRETNGAEHYLWNFSPNQNQSKEQFLKKWVSKLYSDNEALVVEVSGQLLVADSFSHEEFAVKEDVFSDVTVGTLTMGRSFLQSQVIYLKLGETSMRSVLNALYHSYSRLLDYTLKSYQRSRGMKGILTVESLPGGTDEEMQNLNRQFQQNYKTFAGLESSVLTLRSGLEYKDLAQRTYSNEGTRDIRAMIDDVFDFTAKGFGIPPAMLSGKVAGTADAVDDFITFPLAALTKLLETEINRKRNGAAGIAAGNYLKIDTRTVRELTANEIDKLLSCGFYSVNELRRLCGEPEILEEWAYRHFITKNYEELTPLKGGE